MTFFRLLAQIADADVEVALVGEKAIALKQLKQLGLPVVEGGVLLATLWGQHLGKAAQGHPSALEALSRLAVEQPAVLQQIATALQQSLLELPLPIDLDSVLEHFQTPWLMLRPSLFLAGRGPLARSLEADLLGLLPGRICLAQPAALAEEIKQLWAEGLRACNLVVWQKYCQSLRQVKLATLVQPLYPAEVSGTLILSDRTFAVEAVLGLGLVLSQGEAVPARCLAQLGQEQGVTWQSGYQERVYRLRQTSAGGQLQPSDSHPERYLGGLTMHHREDPELPGPLTLDRLRELLRLGRRVQQQWGGAVRLEWLVYQNPQTQQPTPLLLQVSRWPEALVERSLATAVTGPTTSGSAADPLLPLIKAVVQGIGVSAGRVLGLAVVLPPGPLAAETVLPPGCIVVVPDLQPDMGLRLQAVAGIVTMRGGATCHAAILARELRIPAVVGAPHATELLSTGDALWLDGDRGTVYLLPADQALRLPEPLPAAGPVESLPAALEPTKTRVMVNLSQPASAAQLPVDAADGVGLVRSEWLLMEALAGRHPQHWLAAGRGAELQAHLVEKLAPILAAFAPKPVRYRSLDLRALTAGVDPGQAAAERSAKGSTGAGSWADGVAEPNPMLGLRGTLSYQLDPRLFKLELGALAQLQQQGHSNLQLLLPFVRSVEEFTACRQWVEQAGLAAASGFQLWIMAEVPSVLFLLPAYQRAGVQGIAIGTNDLTQLLLAIDRDQPLIAAAYDERHPVVMAALAHLVQTAQQQGLACSICGQAPVRHPALIEQLVQWGIASISVEPAALAATRHAVRQAEQRDRPL